MVVIALAILYQAYQRFLSPKELVYPQLAMVTLLGAGSISLYRAFQMMHISKKYDLLSLKAGAYNSIKDGSASFIVFFSVLAAHLGFPQMDAVGGMVIAFFILSIAYVAIKESSLVLVDACHCPELIDEVKSLIEEAYKVQVKEMRMRKIGPYLTGELSIYVDGSMTLYKVSELRSAIERDIKREINGIERLTITAYPYPITK
jgi:cation diffusion facilitator family transporter